MTATAEAAPTAERRGVPIATTPPGGTFWTKLPVRVSVILIAAIWTLPTFGLLITFLPRAQRDPFVRVVDGFYQSVHGDMDDGQLFGRALQRGHAQCLCK